MSHVSQSDDGLKSKETEPILCMRTNVHKLMGVDSPKNFSVGVNRIGFRSPSNIVVGRGGLQGCYYVTVTVGRENSE